MEETQRPTGGGPWIPPFRPWGWIGEPTCSVTVNGPAQPVIATVADEMRRKRLRVKVAPDGRSMKATSSIGLVLNLIQVFNPTEFVTSPAVAVAVAEEGPWGTRFSVTVKGDLSSWVGSTVLDALNRAAWALAQSRMTVTAGPWETYAYLRRTREKREKRDKHDSS